MFVECDQVILYTYNCQKRKFIYAKNSIKNSTKENSLTINDFFQN